MDSIKVGDRVETIEHDGIVSHIVDTILWRPHGTGNLYYDKDEILMPAKDWCIFLFLDGAFSKGCYIQKVLPRLKQ